MIEVVINYVCVALIVMAVAAAMVGCCDVGSGFAKSCREKRNLSKKRKGVDERGANTLRFRCLPLL